MLIEVFKIIKILFLILHYFEILFKYNYFSYYLFNLLRKI